MKKIILLVVVGVMIFGLTGCKEEEEVVVVTDAMKFKEEYESLNGDSNYRTVSIPETNPFVYSDAKDILERIENGETFYVYFGSAYCPWCRSLIEKAIELADYANIDKVYYVDIWGDDYEEILRDVYKLNDDDEPELVSEGALEYQELLKHFEELLDDYNLTNDDNKKIPVGEKRIYVPYFVYVENGLAVRNTEVKSELQTDKNQELTEEILKDQETMFSEFFVNEDLCNEDKEQGC